MTLPDRTARDDIIGRLRDSLNRPGPLFRGERDAPASTVAHAPVTQADGDARSLITRFGQQLTKVQGSYEIVPRREQVAARVIDLTRGWVGADVESPEILSWAPEELPIEDLDAELNAAGVSLVVPDDLHNEARRRHAAALVVGITGVDAAFASTGSVALVPSPGRSRAASLLPLYHLMLVPASRIYPTLEAWVALLRQAGKVESLLRENSQVAFVTGPSKSADIELNLTLGVHGPKVVHALVFEG